MKNQRTLLSLLSFLLIWGCTPKITSDEKPGAMKAKAPKLVKLKKRPQSPAIKTIREILIPASGEGGTLLNETIHNKSGVVQEVKSYDFFGSGKQTGSTKNTIDQAGNIVKTVDDNEGEITTYEYEYNAEKKKIKETWSRTNGLGEITVYLYNEKGDLVEMKYLTLDGKHDFSRVKEYEYDDAGRAISEKQIERYTDGTNDLLQYHNTYNYNEQGKVEEENVLNENGGLLRTKNYTYNEYGLQKEKLTQSRNSIEKEVYIYNEYGEMIEDKSLRILSDGTEVLDIHSKSTYDKYGNKLGYTYLKGSADGKGTRYEYEVY